MGALSTGIYIKMKSGDPNFLFAAKKLLNKNKKQLLSRLKSPLRLVSFLKVIHLILLIASEYLKTHVMFFITSV